MLGHRQCSKQPTAAEIFGHCRFPTTKPPFQPGPPNKQEDCLISYHMYVDF